MGRRGTAPIFGSGKFLYAYGTQANVNQVGLLYILVHTQPYYQRLGFRWGQFPMAEGYYKEAISLPLYFELTEAQQDRVLETLNRVLS